MSNLPTHTAWVVREGAAEGQKGFWMEVGSGWANADGSITLRLDAVPTAGKLIVRERQAKPAS